MADVLSQDEINALIETYKASGNQSEGAAGADKQVRLYDFARPDKFSKDHLRSLNIIHSKHGASFSGALATMLRLACQVDLLALDQLTYREYCASVPEGTLFVEVTLDPLTTTAIFEFNPSFTSLCVDVLAGAPSVKSSATTYITDVDKSIMKPVVELALKKYVEAWSACIELTPSINLMTTESSTRHILLPSEAVLVSGYEVTIGESTSMMSICMPASSIEAVLPALALGRALNSTSRKFDEANEALRRSFELVGVNCQALLGKTSLLLSDVINLEVGDLIKLPTKAGGQVEFWVENVPAYMGYLGTSGKNFALQIANPITEID